MPARNSAALLIWRALERSDGVIAGFENGRLAFASEGLRVLLQPGTEATLEGCLGEALARDASSHVEVILHDGRAPRSIGFEVFPFDGPGRLAVALGLDLTEQRAREADLERKALSDPLTGLPNRVLFADRVRQALLTAARASTTVSLMVFDLDRFKEVNDTAGHRVGDLLLRDIADRVRLELRDSDTVARLGGDEFAILLPPPSDVVSAYASARKVYDAIARPFRVAETLTFVTASMGIASFPAHGLSVDALLDRADRAMYAAKRLRSGIATYDPDHDLRSPEVLARLGALRTAIESGGLDLQFQPTVRLSDGQPLRMEALVRWPLPNGDRLPPAAFVPLAEHGGPGLALAKWVLARALLRCREWRHAGVPVGVSVNMTPRDLVAPDFAEHLKAALVQSGLEPSCLTLEVSEGALSSEMHRLKRPLREIVNTGVRLALDDFGVGDASLTLLRRLPFREVKIDRRFVRRISVDPDSLSFVRGGIDLGLEIAAEGVDDAQTAETLSRLRCDLAQGHHFMRTAVRDQFVFLGDSELASSLN